MSSFDPSDGPSFFEPEPGQETNDSDAKLSKGGIVGGWCCEAMWFVVPLVVGVSIPSFYDWTEADQSRPSMWVSAAILGPLIVAAGTSLILPWWPARWMPFSQGTEKGPPALRPRIIHLLMITTAIAVLISSYPVWPQGIAISVAVASYIAAIVVFVIYPGKRWVLAQLLACLLLPSLWIFWFGHLGEPGRRLLGWLGFFPSLLPSMIVGSFLDGTHFTDSPLATLVVGLQLAVCLLAILSGGWRATRIALLWTLAIAWSSSMILNALIRI